MHRLSDEMASIGITGDQMTHPLKPLNAIALRGSRGDPRGTTRDAEKLKSLGSCRPDYCSSRFPDLMRLSPVRGLS